MARKIRWVKGTPLMICPACASNSAPDFIDFSRKGKPANVVMRCTGCGTNWGFEVDQAKGADGKFYRSSMEVNYTC